MRRTTAWAGLTLLLAAFLPPGVASAHPEHGQFAQWRAPGEDERLSGRNVHIRARVAFGEDGVQSWAVEVLAPPGASYPGFGTVCEQTVGGAPTTAEIDCPWDTTAYPGGELSQNRAYVIRITATNAERSVFSPAPEAHTTERNVSVVNPVAAPSDVRLSFSEAQKLATVRWAPNPEPDITGYVIQEQFGSGQWRVVGEAGSQLHRFTRRLSTPGTYRYQVAARRSTGTGSDTIRSPFSGPSGEPRQIEVAEPPKPTTTTTTAPPRKKGSGRSDPPSSGKSPGGGDAGGGESGRRDRDETPVPVPAGPGDGEAPAPPDGDADAAPPVPGAGRSGAANLISPIAPGRPGSVGSEETSAGNLVQKGAAPEARPAPASEPQPDGPYSETLPYPKVDPPVADEEEGIRKVLVGLPELIGDDNRREQAIPLAAGLLIFVAAMQAFYLSRKAGSRPPDIEP